MPSLLENMTWTAIFLLSLVSPLLSGPVQENTVQQRIFSWFQPDCSRPVFAPFGLYNPCPDTALTTEATISISTSTTSTSTTSNTSTNTNDSSACKGWFGFGILNYLLGISCDQSPTTTVSPDTSTTTTTSTSTSSTTSSASTMVGSI